MRAGKSSNIETYVMVLDESSVKYILYGDEVTLPSRIKEAYPYSVDSQIPITGIQEIPYQGIKGKRKFQLELTTTFNLTYTHHVYISNLKEYHHCQIGYRPKHHCGGLSTPISQRIIRK